jgi:hypothetical protein
MPTGSVGPTFTSKPPRPNGRKLLQVTANEALPIVGEPPLVPMAGMPALTGEPAPTVATP